MRFGQATEFLKNIVRAVRTLGPVPSLQWTIGTAQYRMKFRNPKVWRLQTHHSKAPLKLRAFTSDLFVFRQIMIEQEYLPLRHLSVSTIMDLGANIGLASVWLLHRFPKAKVLAVEPDRSNFDTCSENLASFGERAKLVRGAVWSRSTKVALSQLSCHADGIIHEDVRDDSNQIQAWDFLSLFKLSGFPHIDLLKIDIEGAESQLFSARNAESWLPFVSNICIELHGSACRDVFFEALSGYRFDHQISGELDICTNIRRNGLSVGAS